MANNDLTNRNERVGENLAAASQGVSGSNADEIIEGFRLNLAANKYDKVTDKARELEKQITYMKQQLEDLDPQNKSYDKDVDKLQNKIKEAEDKLLKVRRKVHKVANKLNTLDDNSMDESINYDEIISELNEIKNNLNEAMSAWNNREIKKPTAQTYVKNRIYSGVNGDKIRSLVESGASCNDDYLDYYVGIIRSNIDNPNSSIRVYDAVSKINRYLK